MSDYDNNLRGAMFKAEKRDGKQDADYRGQCEIDGKHFWIDAWINISKKYGSKYMALKFKPKQERTDAPKNPPAKPDFDDEIPF